MKWLFLLALAAACHVSPRDDTCRLAQRVADKLAHCKQADQKAVADLMQLSLHATGTAAQRQFECAVRLEAVHGAAFRAGCLHQLTRLEMGELDDVIAAGPNGSASADAGSPTAAAAGSARAAK